MSRSFYETAERQAELLRVAKGWIGTPFHAHAQMRGIGTDCVNLVAAIYIETGFFPSDYTTPAYRMDEGIHSKKSKVITEALRLNCFDPIELPTRELQTGDLLCFKFSGVPFHTGLVISPLHFLQVFCGHRVAQYPLRDTTWEKRITHVFRPRGE